MWGRQWSWLLLGFGVARSSGSAHINDFSGPIFGGHRGDVVSSAAARGSDLTATTPLQGAVGLEWEDIRCSTKDQRLRPGRQILKGVSGKARAGRLLAIMGPSGSGKTTLLNTLSGQLPYQRYITLTGQVFVTEADVVKGGGVVATAPGGRSAPGFVFVKQEDLFYSHLTVRESLMFTARLRLPKTMTVKEKRAYVDNMIFRMGLTDVADTLVGDEKRRGISGGERKRLSLACELMGNPSKVIFADEPTSGLDSFQSQIVMESLKQLCRDGHTVIVSIHQPRSTVYQMFDDIILLSDGQVVYHGVAEGATEHLENLGFECPFHFNPAEYMLDLVSIDNSSPATRAESTDRVHELARAYRLVKDKETTVVSKGVSVLPVKRVPIREYMAEGQRLSRRRAGWFEQFRLLIGRQWKQTSRDLFTNGMRAVSTIALAALFGSIFQHMGLQENGVTERSAVLMHTCINTGMIAMVKTLNLFTRERAIVGRERTKNLYGTSAYVLSKVFGELPIDASFPVMFGSILYPLTGLQTGHSRFFKFIGALALQTLTASALGLTIGSFSPSTEAALALGPSLMVVFILLSGQVGTSNSKIPVGLRWVQELSIIRWAFEALVCNEFDGLFFEMQNPQPLARILPGLPKTVQVSGQDVLGKLELGPAPSLNRALRSQMAIMTGNYLLTYMGLRFRAPRFQPLLPPPPTSPLNAIQPAVIPPAKLRQQQQKQQQQSVSKPVKGQGKGRKGGIFDLRVPATPTIRTPALATRMGGSDGSRVWSPQVVSGLRGGWGHGRYLMVR